MKLNRFFKLLLVLCVLVLIVADVLHIPGNSPEPAETAPATEPAETVPTETEPPAEAGPGITVDGDVLASGSLLFEDELYVNAREFLTALDRGNWSGDDAEGFLLEWENRVYQISPERETVLVDHQAIALFQPVRCYRDEIWLPLDELCTMLNISLFEDPEEDHIYCTSGILIDRIPGNIRVPVLMYHAVDSQTWGHRELFVTPEVMEQHIRYLLDNGYDPIFFEDLPNLSEYDKPVIITFDDGYRNNYTELYPLLQKYQVKATIFIVTSSIGNKETSMTPEQVKELSDSGLVSIQSHTVNHRVLRGLSAEEQRMEMEQSKLLVTRMTGREPFVISYPTGVYDENTLVSAKEFYRFGVIVLRGDYITGTDPWTIRRYNVRDTTTMEDLALMLCDAGEPGR